MNILYAIENSSAVSGQILQAAGLSYLQPAEKMVQASMMQSPGAAGNCVLFWADREDTKNLRYKPAEQIWLQSLDKKFWLGYYKNSPPTEEQLRRPSIIDGHPVELLAGQKFTIPVARCFPAGTRLPRSIQLAADGTLGMKLLPAYAAFSRKAEDLWQIFAKQIGLIDETEHQITPVDQWILAAEAVKLNYYAGADEINLLGLLTTETFSKVVLAIIDEPTFTEALLKIGPQLKKNGPDGTTGAAGQL